MSGSGFIKGQVDTELTASIDPSGLATQATLAALNGKVTACNTGAVAGAVTANAGTNLNTSALALEGGGNLAAIRGKTDNIPADPAKESGKLTDIAARLTDGANSAAALLASILASVGATAGAAVVTDAAGTLQQYLRGLVTLIAARLPAIGPQAAAASMSVVASQQPCTVAPVEIAITDGTSTQSAALTAGRYIITSDLDVAFLQGADPTATAASCKLPEGSFRWIDIVEGNKVAAIRKNTSETGVVSLERQA